MTLHAISNQGTIIKIGAWHFHVDQHILSQPHQTKELEPLTYKLLIYFIDNNNRIVSRKELVDNVWQQAYVDDNAINRAISGLRKALKSDADSGTIIKTHYRVGYSFVANIEPVTQTSVPPSETSHSTLTISPEIDSHSQPLQRETPLSSEAPTSTSKSKHSKKLIAVLCGGLFLGAAGLFVSQNDALLNSVSGEQTLSLKSQPLSWHKGQHLNLSRSNTERFISFLRRSMTDKSYELYVIDLRTQREYLIAHDVKYAKGWASDKDTLYYVKTHQDNSQKCDIWQVEGLITPHPIHKKFSECPASWGQTYDFMVVNDELMIHEEFNFRGVNGLDALVVSSLDNGEHIRITTPNASTLGDKFRAFDSKNRRIFFERVHSNNSSELFMVSLDGSNQVKLTDLERQIWTISYLPKYNQLAWYDRVTQKMGGYDLENMVRLEDVSAPIENSTHVVPLSKDTLVITTNAHVEDAMIIDTDTDKIRLIGHKDTIERATFYLGNNQFYTLTETMGEGQKHWLTEDNEYRELTGIFQSTERVLDSCPEQGLIVSVINEHLIMLRRSSDWKVVQQFNIEGEVQDGKLKGDYIAFTARKPNTLDTNLTLYSLSNNSYQSTPITNPQSFDWLSQEKLVYISHKLDVKSFALNGGTEETLNFNLENPSSNFVSVSKDAVYASDLYAIYRIPLGDLQTKQAEKVWDAHDNAPLGRVLLFMSARDNFITTRVIEMALNEIKLILPEQE